MHLRDKLFGTTRVFDKPDDGVAAPTPAPTPAPAPEPAPEPVSTPEPTPTPTPAPEQEASKKSWKDDRIAELTAKLNAEKAKRIPAPTPTPTPTEPSLDERIQSEATRLASEMAAAQDWNNRCNAVNEAGEKEFKDFGDRLKNCQSVVNFSDQAEFAAFNSMIAAAMETGHAHKLIHELGENPGEVKRILGLSPVKMAMELGTRATKFAPKQTPAAPPVSGAPAPIEPIGSVGNHYDGLDPRTKNGAKLPIGEWMKQREKQAQDAGIQ